MLTTTVMLTHCPLWSQLVMLLLRVPQEPATLTAPLTYGVTLVSQREASLGPRGEEVGLWEALA